MTWSVSWGLLAAAIWLAPAARPRRAMPPPSNGQQRLPLPVLRLLVAVAAVAGCLATLGPTRGLPAGGVLALLVAHLITKLHARPARHRPDRALALSLDLAAAALRIGQPVSAALTLAAPAAGAARAAALTQVAGLIRLGADAPEAWRLLADDDVLAPVAQAACRSADSGIRLAHGLGQVAADIRAKVMADATARAHRAGVLAMAPLGLCFLPAFVCLGVVPVVVGIAQGVFGALP